MASESPTAPLWLDGLLAAAIRVHLGVWAPRLGIAERIMVEVFPEDDPEARCAMVPAAMVPEAQGLWDFVLEASEETHPDDLEHTVIHELVHLMLEPVRSRLFYGMDAGTKSPKQWALEREWETVVQRLADAYERAYASPGR